MKTICNCFTGLLVLVHTTALTKGLYGWCGPYDTFCLFSEGIETRVSDLSEAQFKCSEIKNDSWPVELGDARVKDVYIEFIQNYSISNVILNAFNLNGMWYWKRSNMSVQFDFNVKDNIMFYINSGSYSNYSVVCMTDCRANWTDINQTRLVQQQQLTYYNLNINTTDECKEFCEKNITCSSIDWTYGSPFHGCWVHKYPYDVSNLYAKDDTSHHVIDRTVKSTDRCIGEAFVPSPESTQKKPPIESTKLVEILVPIFLIVSILVIVITIIILYKRKIKKTDNSEDFGAFRAAENGGYSESPEDENKTPNHQLNIYHHAEEITKEPIRYQGPRGDQYTEVEVQTIHS